MWNIRSLPLLCDGNGAFLQRSVTSSTSFRLQNREMHDHLDYYLAGQEAPPLESTVKKPEVVYR